LFAEQGFDGTTVDAIASRAETSIGSVYQFFDNKTDIFRAVAERCLEASRQLFARMVTSDAVGPDWEPLLDAAVEAFYTLQETEPAYRAIWANLQLYGEFAEADEALLREMIEGTAALFAIWRPDVEEAQRRLIAKMVVTTISSLLLFIAREEKDDARAMVEETKRMLRVYVASHLSEPPAS
jgi:AcrR family transcriptional regulator